MNPAKSLLPDLRALSEEKRYFLCITGPNVCYCWKHWASLPVSGHPSLRRTGETQSPTSHCRSRGGLFPAPAFWLPGFQQVSGFSNWLLWWLIVHFNSARPQYPDIWLNASPDVAVKVFLDKINIEVSSHWVKEIALHNVGGPRSISWRH